MSYLNFTTCELTTIISILELRKFMVFSFLYKVKQLINNNAKVET